VNCAPVSTTVLSGSYRPWQAGTNPGKACPGAEYPVQLAEGVQDAGTTGEADRPISRGGHSCCSYLL
jgi:hypothetical protein